ncbi:hypothetical protein BDY21DRAFT_367651 [Lineolata rhizophorae]|uniref:Uncharacterized protein n=1 Tax=Lineolata rhizophorae TaxID=578093 RepID=A0A6A6NMZ2_9PEZI|nr:hypothetical protein BDY21DRAFT_367651 [Lineolata rhizophorae]
MTDPTSNDMSSPLQTAHPSQGGGEEGALPDLQGRYISLLRNSVWSCCQCNREQPFRYDETSTLGGLLCQNPRCAWWAAPQHAACYKCDFTEQDAVELIRAPTFEAPAHPAQASTVGRTCCRCGHSWAVSAAARSAAQPPEPASRAHTFPSTACGKCARSTCDACLRWRLRDSWDEMYERYMGPRRGGPEARERGKTSPSPPPWDLDGTRADPDPGAGGKRAALSDRDRRARKRQRRIYGNERRVRWAAPTVHRWEEPGGRAGPPQLRRWLYADHEASELANAEDAEEEDEEGSESDEEATSAQEEEEEDFEPAEEVVEDDGRPPVAAAARMQADPEPSSGNTSSTPSDSQ